MKHLWITITLLAALLMAPTAWAEDYKIDAMSEEKVQLDVAIRFNAIKPGDAVHIMELLRSYYGSGGIGIKACKLNYTLSSPAGVFYTEHRDGSWVDSYPDPHVFDFSHQGATAHTFAGDPCYDSEETARRQCDDGYRDTGSQPGRYCCD